MSEESTLFILYGSATGNAEHIAKDLAARPNTLFNKVLCFELDQFKRKCQPTWEKETTTKHAVLIVTSTTGNGDAPENASRFVRYIKRSQTVDEKPFRHVAYAVLGLGDTNYDQFCQCAKVIDKKLLELGGTRIRPLTCADEATGLEEAVEPWTERILDEIAAACRGSGCNTEEVCEESKESIEENQVGQPLIVENDARKLNVSDGVATVRALFGLEDKSQPIWIPDAKCLPSLIASRSCELFVPTEESTDFSCSDSFTTTSSSGLHYTMKHPFESTVLNARYLTNTSTNAAEEAMGLLQLTETGMFLDESLLKASKVIESHFSLSPQDETCTQEHRDRNGKRVIELSLALPDDYTLEYAPGDSLGLLVENTPESVQFVLDMLQKNHGIHSDQQVSIDEGRAVTLEEVARRHFDLCSPVKSKRILFGLSQFATDEEERVALQFLSSKTPEGDLIFKSFIEEQRLNVVDLLREFPSTQGISMQGLFGMLPALLPRYYSVSSSPLKNVTSVTIAFSVVDYITPSLKICGRERGLRRIGGVATRFLETICSPLLCSAYKFPTNDIKVKIFPKPTAEFRMPKALSTPLILIGPGTGIAPFMGFLAHRRALTKLSEDHATSAAQTVVEGMWRGGYDVMEKDMSIHSTHDLLESVPGERENRVGSVDLFFGCRHADHDWLYRKEMEDLLDEKILSALNTAFSRDGPNKVYVQDKFFEGENSERLLSLITEQNASIYVCGDGNAMARDVKDAIVKLLSQKMGDEDASGYLETMKKQNRFLLDIWS
jgi:sulfite reductase alpha subunit-like flavoprotein